MAQFILVLRDGPADLSKYGPEELQAMLQKYEAWAGKLGATGKLVGGQKLKDFEGRLVRGHGEKAVVTDGPFGETKEVIGGFYTIEAKDYEEALALTRDHAHLEYGGTVELRQVDMMEEHYEQPAT